MQALLLAVEIAPFLRTTKLALIRRVQREAKLLGMARDRQAVVWLGIVEARKLGNEWRFVVHWECTRRCVRCGHEPGER